MARLAEAASGFVVAKYLLPCDLFVFSQILPSDHMEQLQVELIKLVFIHRHYLWLCLPGPMYVSYDGAGSPREALKCA